MKNKKKRRDFLKILGFTTLSVTLAACKGPVIESIPYIIKPDSITPGVYNYYASTMFDGFDFGNVIVKTIEGRPIGIESNKKSKYFNSMSSRIKSSILSLYDNERLKFPSIKKRKISWKKIDKIIINELRNISNSKKKIVILTSSLPSPSTREIIYDFTKVYKNTNHIIYDNISYSSTLDAVKKVLGIRAIPYYDLSEIELLISFDADFLGDWSPQDFHKSYSKSKKPNLTMLNHIQLESNMSLSGANADLRIPINPHEIYNLLIEVYKAMNNKSSNRLAVSLVKKIFKKGKKTLIIADGNQEMYEISLLMNNHIQSNAIKNKKFIFLKESNDKIILNLMNDLAKKNVGALLIFNTNPVYSFFDKKKIDNIKDIPLTISFAMKEDETSDYMDIWVPIPHWLESWGDYIAITGMYSLRQPTIRKIFNTRQFEDTLLKWIKGNPEHVKINDLFLNTHKIINYYDYLKFFFEEKIIKRTFLNSFNKALFYGSIKIKERKIDLRYKKSISFLKQKKINKFELRLYTKVSMGDGRQFDNPWLQELPDPITRTTWENYMTMSYTDANALGIKNWHVGNGAMNGNCVNLIFDSIIIKNIPVYIQPGQSIGCLGLSFGYGRKKGKIAKQSRGINAYALYKNFNSIQDNIKLEKSKKKYKFSCIQLQNTTVGRNNIARETDLFTYLNTNKVFWNKEFLIKNKNNKINGNKITIWESLKEDNGHHFNISIDLNKCTGCTSCIIACNSENNIPVVGKEEVRKYRDMHWLRIDRYFSTKKNKKKYNNKNPFIEPFLYKNYLEPEYKNPKVIFQPIMCQHCNNAPCETVCPVGATTHGKQGQNMMTYNRCIGTRYCANNCPYKVRRFNWFNYYNKEQINFNLTSKLSRMILNPNVVVRSRGVMEKCSMCIQLTQSIILTAKKEERKIKNNEFQTACSKICPTNAIIFGDINNKRSKIFKRKINNRSYKLLDFLGVKPNVFYQVKIRNLKKNKY
ncbi:Molybdopterin oxidoreductase, iron-sulfur binding subunit [Candidatus Karelsulcia muelleri]|nr:Molybdopterin oxidoreductase, iron-sulfur binding subunit [Candidatus Karelsulcia muelleri]